MVSTLGLIGGLDLLVLLTMRGAHMLVAAPLAAALVAATSGIAWLPPLAAPPAPDFATAYAKGFTGFFGEWFFMILLGAIFGEAMGTSGAAASVARWVTERLGPRHAVLAVVAACAVLTYGGVSVFVVAFSVYPLAVHLFRQADLPRRFIPGAIGFGAVTFTMTSAGSPEIQNLIPMPYLGTTALAAWEVSLAVAVLMAVLGSVWLRHMVRRAVARGERFEGRIGDPPAPDPAQMPGPLLSIAPLVVAFVAFLVLQYPRAIPGLAGTILPEQSLGKWSLVVALGLGVIAALLVGIRNRAEMPAAFNRGAQGAMMALTNTSAVVGFGAVAQLAPAFQQCVALVQTLPGDPLIGAAIAVAIIAGLTGSASGGQSIALPLLAPHYLEAGVDPNELHRVVAISSGTLDSLPHNGFVVTTIRAVCGETHARAYAAMGAMTVVVPAVGLVVALVLFRIF